MSQITDYQTDKTCPVCGSKPDAPFYQMTGVPTLDGAVGETLEEAQACPVGDVTLCLCGTCGWIGNASFEPGRLSYEKYHFSLQHSPAFEAFVGQLVDSLADRHNLSGGRVMDVGCGAGDFLRTFAKRQPITGLGIDPSIAAGTETFDRGSVTFERGLLKPEHSGFHADLSCCRHVLNSMPDPLDLLRQIRAVAADKPDTRFYFEVPHASRTFNNDIVWNIAYEHHNWFNETSFRVLCERAGYEVTAIGPCWGDEYLGAECVLGDPKPDSVAPAETIEALRKRVAEFAETVRTYAQKWSERLAELNKTGKRVAIWGAGARALLFLNQIENMDHVGCVVDINPDRQGRYLAHICVKIDAPEAIHDFKPDLMLISNSAFAEEIKAQARELGINAEMEVF